MKITLETQIQEALALSSKVTEVFDRYGLECLQCHGSSQDRIRHIIQNNGLDGETFLSDLNNVL